MAKARGQNHPFAKLTDDKVYFLRLSYAAGRGTCHSIAQEYGLSTRSVYNMLVGKHWAHVPGALIPPLRGGSSGEGQRKKPEPLHTLSPKMPARRKLLANIPDDDIRLMRELYATGEVPLALVARKFELPLWAVRIVVIPSEQERSAA